ncbi:UNVERIFIED_CONTAM: SNF2 domain-containing protein [Williamsia faeni]
MGDEEAGVAQSRAARFEVGEKVALRVDDHKVGVVIRVIPHGTSQPRYRVFHGPDEREYDEKQLVLDRSGSESPSDLIAALEEGRFLAPDEFRARVTSERLAHPAINSLYAMRAARILHVPFQYKPLLRLLRADQPRLLIADDVGVGKTIEAGLILKELEARGDVERVLVMCPRSLAHKWRSEMRRFDEDFKILDGATLQHCLRETDIDGWPSEAARAILPMELIQRQEHLEGDDRRPGLLTLEQPPRFDLLIIDEAHHMRNTETARYDAARFLTTISHAVVMLSATPVHTGAENLFTLLQLLRADLFPNYDTFRRMVEPNRHVTNAMRHVRTGAPEDSWRAAATNALESASTTSWGAEALVRAPQFVHWTARLRSAEPMSDEERVTCLRDLEELHSLALVMNRTRRRDIGPFTQREPVTVEVPFTAEQQSFYNNLVAWQRQVHEVLHSSAVANLVLSQIERQAASCLSGVVESLAEVVRTGRLHSRGDSDDEDNEGQMLLPPELKGEAADLLEQARQLPPEDPKLDRLLQLLRDTTGAEDGPGKLLVFTSFRKTIAHLERAVRTGATRIAVVHGDIDDNERQALRARFRLPRTDRDAIDVLLSTEVGAEGLDYEFCDRLVNYDIPWNPMRVEQRIGRIDRFGQRSPKVLIYNFVTPGTVEDRVFMRCYERLGIFRDTVGDLEEVLGETTAALNQLATDPRLTLEQAAHRARQEADNVTRRAEEQRRLEDEAPGLLGLDDALIDEAEAIDARGRFVTGEEVREIVEGFLSDHLHGGSLRPGSSDSTGLVFDLHLRLAEHRQELRSMLSRLPRSDRTALELRKALGDNAPVSLTFDQEVAVARREIHFVTPVHPLARLAVGFWRRRTDPLVAQLSLTDTEIPAGRYLFALERWDELAARPGARLVPVVVGFSNAAPADHVAERLLAAVRVADAVPSIAPGPVSTEATVALDGHAHELRQAAIAHLQETNSALVDQRLASLDLFYRGLLAQLDSVLGASTDLKIIRMKTSERDRHRHEHQRRRAELERRRDADIVSTRIAMGIVEVRDAVGL